MKALGRAVAFAAAGAATMALAQALGANPHALSAHGKRWSAMSLTAKERYVKSNLRHARFAIQFARTHRRLYTRSLASADVVIRQHRRLERKARRNLRAIVLRLHPPFVVGWPWVAIVDCESGDGSGSPPYTAEWTYNDGVFEGGPNFTPETWRDYGGLAYSSHAYDASPRQQITVAERVLADVGWGAWPVCSVKIGVR